LTIPTYSKGKGGSNLRVTDANGLMLGKVVGIGGAGELVAVETIVGGELVILTVTRIELFGTNIVFFKDSVCGGQGFITDETFEILLTAIGGVDNSVYKVLDRDETPEDFTVESLLSFGAVCDDVSFFRTNMLPATRIGDLSEFTTPFEIFE